MTRLRPRPDVPTRVIRSQWAALSTGGNAPKTDNTREVGSLRPHSEVVWATCVDLQSAMGTAVRPGNKVAKKGGNLAPVVLLYSRQTKKNGAGLYGSENWE